MDPVQLKMARAAKGLTIHDLADLAGVSHDTIVRLEAGGKLKPNTVEKVRTALEASGVIFIAENGEGPGVRLKKTSVQTD
jgi:DNA-binding XRE family transcriptional regulator